MSFDLYFWKEIAPLNYSVEEIMTELADDGANYKFASIPVDLVKKYFISNFPEIIDGGSQLDWEGQDGSFSVGFLYSDAANIKMIIVYCGYSMLKSPDNINKIIDIGGALGCSLYDPQVGQRFEPSRT